MSPSPDKTSDLTFESPGVYKYELEITVLTRQAMGVPTEKSPLTEDQLRRLLAGGGTGMVKVTAARAYEVMPPTKWVSTEDKHCKDCGGDPCICVPAGPLPDSPEPIPGHF